MEPLLTLPGQAGTNYATKSRPKVGASKREHKGILTWRFLLIVTGAVINLLSVLVSLWLDILAL
jgi:hypothetical protein